MHTQTNTDMSYDPIYADGTSTRHIESRLAPPGDDFSPSSLGHREPPQRPQDLLPSPDDDSHKTGRRPHFASLPPQPIDRSFGDIPSSRPLFLSEIPQHARSNDYSPTSPMSRHPEQPFLTPRPFASWSSAPTDSQFGGIHSAAWPTFFNEIPRRVGLPSHHPEVSLIPGHPHFASSPQSTYHPIGGMRSQARPTFSIEIPGRTGPNNYNSLSRMPPEHSSSTPEHPQFMSRPTDGTNHAFPTGIHRLAGSDGEHLNMIPAHSDSQRQTAYPQQSPGGSPSRPDDDDSHFVVHAHPDTPSLPMPSSAQSIHSIETPNWLIPEKSARHIPTGYQTLLTNSLYASMPVLHTTNVPNSNILADIALSHFTIDVSPWKDLMNYIDAEANHVNTTIQKLQLLTEEAKIDEAHHSVLISDSNVDNNVTLYRLRRASGRPADVT